MERLCPQCKNDLGFSEKYFCLNCGSRLPDEFINLSNVSQLNVSSPPPLVIKDMLVSLPILVLKKALFFVGSLIAFVVIINTSYNYYFLNTGGRKLSTSTETTKGVLIQEVLKSESTAFLNVVEDESFDFEKYTSMIPYDSDLYIEGHDFTSIHKFIFDQVFTKEDVKFANLLKEIILQNPSGFALFSRNKSLKSGENQRVAAVIFDGNFGSNNTLLEVASKEASVSAKSIYGFLVLASDQELLEDITAAKEKKILSLSLSPKFASEKRSFSGNGKLLVYLSTDGSKKFVGDLASFGLFTDSFSKLLLEVEKINKTGFIVK
ncbi:MAG: hypothetical protein AAB443_03150 [Patescibacteria group bacterium]